MSVGVVLVVVPVAVSVAVPFVVVRIAGIGPARMVETTPGGAVVGSRGLGQGSRWRGGNDQSADGGGENAAGKPKPHSEILSREFECAG